MQFEDYQRLASVTAIYPNKGNNLYYPALGLGESGEVQNKVKKVMRDHNGIVSEEYRKEISKELGDILWYIAAMCEELGIDMDDVAQDNIDKLYKRMRENKLKGDGDNR